jgi:endoglucanase
MDDRAGLAIMTALLESIDRDDLGYDVTFVATVLEETGLEGAHSVGYREAFDLAVAIDVGLAGDVPTVDIRDVPVRLGEGPAIVHKDGAIHYNRRVNQKLIEAAERAGVPFQHAIFIRYSSDGAAFIRNGIPTGLLAFPARYTHSPFETVHRRDLQQCVDLLGLFITMTT